MLVPQQRLALVVLLVLAGLIVSACSGGSVPVIGGKKKQPSPGVPALTTGSCWSAAVLGSDHDAIARQATATGLDEDVVEAVMAQRPSFAEPADCAQAHAIEVYRVVQLPQFASRLTGYDVLVRTDQPGYREIGRAVQRACMDPVLARAAARTRLPGVLMEPALPAGMHVTWAPPSPAQFARGERGFACVFTQATPSPVRWSAVFTSGFPTGLRTCILTTKLRYLDCSRRHDRERIAIIQARDAVAAGKFPGRKAIRKGPGGRYLAASPAKYAALDRACTTYLRSISTTRKYTGIAEIDLEYWPAADGSYPIVCEADTRPNRPPVITKGSVYDRASAGS